MATSLYRDVRGRDHRRFSRPSEIVVEAAAVFQALQLPNAQVPRARSVEDVVGQPVLPVRLVQLADTVAGGPARRVARYRGEDRVAVDAIAARIGPAALRIGDAAAG